jgi:hypothetical protein
MAAAAFDGVAPHRAVDPADVVDADYEIVRPGRPEPVPAVKVETAQASPRVGMDMLRKEKSEPERRAPARGGPLVWITGIGIALAAFWVSGGHALVRDSGLFSGPQAVQAAFSVTGVRSRFDVSGAKPVLLVDGEAANEGGEAGVLPPLEIRIAASDGRVTRYTLGTSGRVLAAGERFAFSSRLDVPKNGVGAVSVTFAE